MERMIFRPRSWLALMPCPSALVLMTIPTIKVVVHTFLLWVFEQGQNKEVVCYGRYFTIALPC